ncbi:MAG: AAA family ATPase [Actinomycetota bacterium]|nr:AAA family ATPase [Actinomycetota bacterium]
MSSPLHVALLGTPLIEVDGAPLDVDTRKAVALAAYLAVEGPQTRDTLAALLWPDSEPERARGALRRTLSVLNKALRGRWLTTDRALVALAGAGMDCDVTAFRQRLESLAHHGHPASVVCPVCVPPLEEAVGLHRGDFLSGFALRDAPQFDDWQAIAGTALRRELAGALDRLARALLDGGDLGSALGHAVRRVTLDPLDEPARRRLMLLHAWRGERNEAIRQYRGLVAVLDGTLGVAPVAETTSLYEAIVDDRPPPAPAPLAVGAPAAPRRPSTLPLVGRSREVKQLRERHEDARAGGRLTVLLGEAGVGKSRLAEELLEEVRVTGAAAVAVRCHPSEAHVAYGPIAEALRAFAADAAGAVGTNQHELAEAARLVPELFPDATPPPGDDSPGARLRFLDGVAGVLAAFLDREDEPGLLLVDDLHAADGGTIDVLRSLVRRIAGRSGHVLVCWREEEVGAGHPAKSLLADVPPGGVDSMSVPRLELGHVVELVAAALGPGRTDLARRLHEETEGLPLFVVEYLATITDGELGWDVPKGVREIVRTRLAGLDEVSRQVLTTAAVIGRSVGVETLLRASGRSSEETVVAIETLTGRGLLREPAGVAPGDPRYEFGHERIRAVVYEEASLARRRLLHGRIADALIDGARTPRRATELAPEIARHLQLAGRETEAAEHLRTAGEHARWLHANDEALDHLRTALALGHPDVAPMQEAIGDLETLRGDYVAALRSYETAIARVADPLAVVVLEQKLAGVHLRRGDTSAARSHLESAIADLGDREPGQRARLLADLSLVSARRGDLDAATEQARTALRFAEEGSDRASLAQVRNVLGVLARRRGDLREARRQLEMSAHLATQLPDLSGRVAALNNLALADRDSGDLDHALDHVRRALELCVVVGDRHREAALRNNLADLLRSMGRADEGMDELKTAVRLFADIGLERDPQPEIWKLVEW